MSILFLLIILLQNLKFGNTNTMLHNGSNELNKTNVSNVGMYYDDSYYDHQHYNNKKIDNNSEFWDSSPEIWNNVMQRYNEKTKNKEMKFITDARKQNLIFEGSFEIGENVTQSSIGVEDGFGESLMVYGKNGKPEKEEKEDKETKNSSLMTHSMPCCSESIGTSACVALRNRQLFHFLSRCRTDVAELGRELFAENVKSRHCFDRHNRGYCMHFVQKGKYTTKLNRKVGCNGESANLAFRICRRSCGFCNTALYEEKRIPSTCIESSSNNSTTTHLTRKSRPDSKRWHNSTKTIGNNKKTTKPSKTSAETTTVKAMPTPGIFISIEMLNKHRPPLFFILKPTSLPYAYITTTTQSPYYWTTALPQTVVDPLYYTTTPSPATTPLIPFWTIEPYNGWKQSQYNLIPQPLPYTALIWGPANQPLHQNPQSLDNSRAED